MIDETEHAPKTQFSLRAAIIGITAIAIWLGFLTQQPSWQGQGTVIVTGLGITAGVIGHVFVKLLRFHAMALLAPFLLYSGGAFVIFMLAGSLGPFRTALVLLEIVVAPVAELVMPRTVLSWTSILAGCLTAVVLVPAHFIRPGLPWAIITSLGVSAWYSTGFSICIERYFGA